MVGRKIKLDACKVCGMHKSRCICNIEFEKVEIKKTKSKPHKRTRKEKMPARIKKGN